MRTLGIILVVLGALALAYGGITYTKREKVIDVGPLEASVDTKERIPLSPIAGGLAIAAGVVMLVSRRRTA